MESRAEKPLAPSADSPDDASPRPDRPKTARQLEQGRTSAGPRKTRIPAREDVRLRAGELSQVRGGNGRVTLEDWLQAESELLFWESTLFYS
jgi:hypothetical protein